MLDRATDKEAEIAPVVDETADELHGVRRIRRREHIKERGGLLPIRRAEEVIDFLQRDGSVGESDDHVQHALGIPKGALGVACDRIERGRISVQLLLLDDVRELRDDTFLRDAAEVEALRSRHDGGRDLLRLGRSENEHRVRRGFFEGLQERIERFGRELVRLVDDVHLVLPGRRSETDLIAKVAHLVDAAIRRGVDLDEVQEAALPDRDAGLAAIAWLAVLRVRAIDGLRDEAGDRRPSSAPHGGPAVCLCNLAARDRVPERARDVLLSDDRGEGLGAIAAIESGALGHRAMLMGDGRAPSLDRDLSNTHTRIGSDQACLRHEATTVYRCFLPDLTGFTGRFCTGPDRQRRSVHAGSAMPDLGREFSPAGADCGYRAPLAPRLARPSRCYRAIAVSGPGMYSCWTRAIARMPVAKGSL